MRCRVELANDVSAFTDSSGWEERSSMTEFIKAMRRNWRQSSSSRQHSSNELPEKEDVSWCTTRFILRYNRNPVIIPHWTIRVLVCEQGLRKYLGAVSRFFREQIVAVCYASGISKMFMQMIYEFNDTVFERR
jgi:hypothetical protein